MPRRGIPRELLNVSSANVKRAGPQLPPSWVDPNLPVETIGECRGSDHCRTFVAPLANGWCVEHWDAGNDL